MSDALLEYLEHKQVVVHLGAHKTASSYIQSVLKSQRDRLAREGVALLLPSDLRRKRPKTKRARRAAPDRAAPKPDLTERIEEALADPGTRRVAMSEEGLIGSPRNNLAGASLYPGMMRKMDLLPAALDHRNVTILFAIRDYGPFFSSNVTTAVRRGVIFDPEALRRTLLKLSRSWVDVVTDLCIAFPSARVKIWQYEAFAELEAQVLTALVGRTLPGGKKRNFKTLSREAMQQIAEQLAVPDGPDDARRIIRAATKDFPISPSNPPFSLWSDEEAAALTLRYNDDWQEICKTYPDIALSEDVA